MVDTTTIKLCAQAIVNSYYGKYGEEKEIFRDPQRFKIEHTEGYYAVEETTLYIVFQGSQGIKDWLDNFKFWRRDVRKTKPYGDITNDVEVHSGFITQYQTVRDLIHNIIKENPRCHEIICTGHSLGGALATLCAVDIQYNFDSVLVSCITFGSPRVGNKAFTKSFKRRVPNSIRIVNGSDIVCKVPFLIFFFRHVHNIGKVGKKKWYLISTDDHYPNEYLANCEKRWKSS